MNKVSATPPSCGRLGYLQLALALTFAAVLPRQAYPAAEDANPAAVGKLLMEQMWTLSLRILESPSLLLRLFLARRRTAGGDRDEDDGISYGGTLLPFAQLTHFPAGRTAAAAD